MKIILFYIFVSRFKMRNDFWAEKKEVFVFIEIKTTVVNFHCISIRKSLFDFNIMTRLFYKPLGHFLSEKVANIGFTRSQNNENSHSSLHLVGI